MSSGILQSDEDALFGEAHPRPIREDPSKCGVQRTLTSLCSAYRGCGETHLQRSKETKRNETRHLEREDSK